MIWNKEMEKKYLIRINIKELGLMIKNMEKVFIHNQMEMFIMVNGKKIYLKDKEHMFTKMEINMKDNFIKIYYKVKDAFSIMMDQSIMVNSKII